MRSLLILLVVVFIEMMLQTLWGAAGTFNRTHHALQHSRNRPGKRNTKFIIPAIISHMYHQKLDESPLAPMLSKTFARRVGKQDNGKMESADGSLEHRTFVGNPKRDEHVRNVPKTKCAIVKTKELPDLFEAQSRIKEDERSDRCRCRGANIDQGGTLIQVSKQFSPLSSNWYVGPPSLVWPPSPQYLNSSGGPLEQYHNPRFSRPLYPGSSAIQQGFIQHIMGPTRNKFVANTISKEDRSNTNVVAQERKFMVSNITKYVLNFYCPHCGGEISVSKNKNRGGLFGVDQGTISVHKGQRDPNDYNTPSTTTPYSRETKTQQLN